MTLSYYLIVRLIAAVEMALCTLPYAVHFAKKPAFLSRQALGAGIYCLAALATVGVQLLSSNYLSSLVIQFLLYAGLSGWILLGWQVSPANLVLCLCAGVATQALTGRLTEVFYLLLGTDPYHNIMQVGGLELTQSMGWLLYALIHLVLIGLIWFASSRRDRITSGTSYARVGIVYSILVILVTVLLQNYSRTLEPDHPEMAAIVRALVIGWSIMVLAFRGGLFAQDQISEELRITRYLLGAEKKQFEAIQEDMEMINLKCHDIRHQLDHYAGRLTSSEMEELRDAIQIYDSHLKTGNDVLNMVLYKKQAIMEQRQIALSCMADGKVLNFMEASDLFSMMNNAVDNAIAAVSLIADGEKKQIALNVHEEKGTAIIHVTNYFLPETLHGEGLPETSKSDKALHGFGMRSIQFIAEKYDGLMTYQTEQDLFMLNVCIPIP